MLNRWLSLVVLFVIFYILVRLNDLSKLFESDSTEFLIVSPAHTFKVAEELTYQSNYPNLNHTVVLIVPYRDRDKHGRQLSEHLKTYVHERELRDGNITTFHLVFTEQFDEELFNKGWTFNAAFSEMEKHLGEEVTSRACIMVHDVDILPFPEVNYADCEPPTHFAWKLENRRSSYPGFCGLVAGMKGHRWYEINGMSNRYVGWGKEDDDMFERLKQGGFVKGPNARRPSAEAGHFTYLADRTARDRISFDDVKNVLEPMRRGEPVWKTDGLNSLTYQKVFENHEIISDRFFQHWIAFTSPNRTVDINVEVFVSDRAHCGDQRNFRLERVPVSLTDFNSISGCDANVSLFIMLVDLKSAEIVLCDNWLKLVRWLRRSDAAMSVIVIAETPTEPLRLQPRIYPVLSVSSSDTDFWIEPGTYWPPSGNPRGYIIAYHPEDFDLIPDESIQKVCFGKTSTKQFRISIEDNCTGESFTASTKGEGEVFCLGTSAKLDKLDKGNCTEEGWSSVAFLRSVVPNTQQVLFPLCEKDERYRFCESNEALLRAASPDFLSGTDTYRFCIQEVDESLHFAPCDQEGGIELALPISASSDHYCIGMRSDSSVVCIEQGSCSKCVDGTQVRSVSLSDLSLANFTILRDSNPKRNILHK